MIYEFEVDTTRQVKESFEIAVEANDLEEAQDLVFETMSDWPDSDLVLNRVLRVGVDTADSVTINRIKYMPEFEDAAS